MEISEIRIFPVENGGSLKANATVGINESLVIQDITIVERKDGALWVKLPQRMYEKNGAREYKHIVYFLDKEEKSAFEDIVLQEYHEQTNPKPDKTDKKQTKITKKK